MSSQALTFQGWKSVAIANDIFGFNGWSSSVTSTTIDFVDYANGRFFVGVCAQVGDESTVYF